MGNTQKEYTVRPKRQHSQSRSPKVVPSEPEMKQMLPRINERTSNDKDR